MGGIGDFLSSAGSFVDRTFGTNLADTVGQLGDVVDTGLEVYNEVKFNTSSFGNDPLSAINALAAGGGSGALGANFLSNLYANASGGKGKAFTADEIRRLVSNETFRGLSDEQRNAILDATNSLNTSSSAATGVSGTVGSAGLVQGAVNSEQQANLASFMRLKGYSEADIDKILTSEDPTLRMGVMNAMIQFNDSINQMTISRLSQEVKGWSDTQDAVIRNI